MDSLYTPELQKFVAEHKKRVPHQGLVCTLVEVQDRILFVLYRDNFETFSEPHKQDFVIWIEALLQGVSKLGIPCGLKMEASENSVMH